MSKPLTALRALVLDDDAVYRRIVTTSLQRIGIKEISIAGDLTIARYKLEHEQFDVITIDVVLRDGSGLDILSWVQEHRPELISILVTAGSNSEASREVDGLLLGASALVLKPGGSGAAEKLDQSFRDVIEGILRDRAVMPSPGKPRPAVRASVKADVPYLPPVVNSTTNSAAAAPRELIAVGASTGGPPVIMEFLGSLPKSLRTPIVITQHMPALHIPHFAKLLRERTGRDVAVAKDGEVIQPGRVYVAPGALHLLVLRHGPHLILKHDNGPEEHNCKPAVDPMFRSVAVACGSRCIGVVMTGMGADGALGSLALRAQGAPVVVQDKSSSVVWGMPGATVQKGAASVVAPSTDLAMWVTRFDSGGPTLVAQAQGVR